MNRLRVLVAEDQVLIRLDLHRLLERAGFDVCGMARNGHEAVELALQLRPDIVLLDVNMPELDGIQAARRILDSYEVPIVMLTAYGYGEVVSRALDAGVVGFVVKPFAEADLIQALREASGQTGAPSGLGHLSRTPPNVNSPTA